MKMSTERYVQQNIRTAVIFVLSLSESEASGRFQQYPLQRGFSGRWKKPAPKAYHPLCSLLVHFQELPFENIRTGGK